MVVILVILAVIAGVIWILKAGGDEYDEAVAEHLERDFRLWCPDCQEEFTMSGVEARKLQIKMGEDDEKLVQCPKCKKFVATWRGQGRPGTEQEAAGGVVRP